MLFRAIRKKMIFSMIHFAEKFRILDRGHKPDIILSHYESRTEPRIVCPQHQPSTSRRLGPCHRSFSLHVHRGENMARRKEATGKKQHPHHGVGEKTHHL